MMVRAQQKVNYLQSKAYNLGNYKGYGGKFVLLVDGWIDATTAVLNAHPPFG